jgi:hypothetical protein
MPEMPYNVLNVTKLKKNKSKGRKLVSPAAFKFFLGQPVCRGWGGGKNTEDRLRTGQSLEQ